MPEDKLPGERIIGEQSEEQLLRIEFGSENARIMQAMVRDKFGKDEKDLVINALTLLYTIAQKAPKAREVMVQSENSIIYIPVIKNP